MHASFQSDFMYNKQVLQIFWATTLELRGNKTNFKDWPCQTIKFISPLILHTYGTDNLKDYVNLT